MKDVSLLQYIYTPHAGEYTEMNNRVFIRGVIINKEVNFAIAPKLWMREPINKPTRVNSKARASSSLHLPYLLARLELRGDAPFALIMRDLRDAASRVRHRLVVDALFEREIVTTRGTDIST